MTDKMLAYNLKRLDTRSRDDFILKNVIRAQADREWKKLVDSPPGTPSSVSSVELRAEKKEDTAASHEVEAKEGKTKPKAKPKVRTC